MTPKQKGLQKVGHSADYPALLSFATKWVKEKMYPFTSEDLKTAYEAVNPKPKQPNIYGATINAMASKKLIYEAGTARAKLPAAHNRLMLKWISHEYRQHQSEKAKKNQTLNLFEGL